MNAAVRWLLIVVIVSVAAGTYLAIREGSDTGTSRDSVTGAGTDSGTGAARKIRWQSSVQCRDCHGDVWDEWHGTHHQISYQNEEVRRLSNDFRDKVCADCHLPQPVARTGFGNRVLARASRPDEGVGCLTCHLGPGGEVLGARELPDAPCAPVRSDAFASVDMCASCHNQHWTTDQWTKSTWASERVTCNDCHMPDVERRLRDGTTKIGRGHGFAGSHDVATLRSAIAFDAGIDVGGEGAEQLVVVTTNILAGHSFPTEERSRAADIRFRFLDGEGAPLDESWTDAFRFRLPYRNEELPDTQLPAGETEVVHIDVPDDARGAAVRLWYRTQPYVGDDHWASTLLEERLVEWAAPPLEPMESTGFGAATRAAHVAVYRANLARERAAAAARRGRRAAAVASATSDAGGAVPGDAGAGAGAGSGPALLPMLPTFAALAAQAPDPPTAERQAELVDLLETAFLPGRALPRFQKLAERTLDEADDAVWAFEGGLAHAAPVVRAHCAFRLGQSGHRPAVPPLLLRLKDDEDVTVLVWAADALAALGNHAGLNVLAQILDRADAPDARQAAGTRAVAILRASGRDPGAEPTWEALRDGLLALHAAWLRTGRVAGDAAGRGDPAAAGADTPPPALDPWSEARLAAHLVDLEGFQLRPVDEARFVLVRMGRSALPLLAQAVRARETFLRNHSLEVVHDLGPVAGELGDAVVPLLREPISAALSARTLGAVGAVHAVPELIALLDGADDELAAAAAEALGPLGDPAALVPLRRLFGDAARPLDVRVRCAFSLAMLDPEDPAGRAFLEQRKAQGDYHAPTIDELLARLASRDR